MLGVFPVFALLLGCQYADAASLSAAEGVFRQMYAEGTIDQGQLDALIGALYAQGGPDWALIGAIAGNFVLTSLGLPAWIKYKARQTGSRLGGGVAPTPE
jgi:hypothetical protein